MKIKEITLKILWAMFNLLPPRPIFYPKRDVRELSCNGRTLVVLIDYDGFAGRLIKTVNSKSYDCGRPGLDHVVSYCRAANLDYVDVLTTDSSTVESVKIEVNQAYLLKNGGTDVAALFKLRDFILQYNNIVVVNSSLNSNDASLIREVHLEANSLPIGSHYVIGCNGNSRLSPRLPLFSSRSPHVITNFFSCPSLDAVHTLEYAMSLNYAERLGGYSNKYFAIRYFEVLLSLNAIKNNGKIILLKDGVKKCFTSDGGWWPKRDSRFNG